MTRCFEELVETSVSQIKEYYEKNYQSEWKENFDHVFQLSHQAGDDVNCVCSAALTFPFAKIFYKNLENVYFWEHKGTHISLRACMGIAFMTKDCDYHTAFRTAEMCCKNAKLYALREENLRDGYAGNWVDCQICDQSSLHGINQYRKSFTTTKNGFNPMFRPYCLDREAEGETYSFDVLLDRAAMLRKLSLSKEELFELRIASMSDPENFEKTVKLISMKTKKDMDQIAQVSCLRYDDVTPHLIWFDALNVWDFLQ